MGKIRMCFIIGMVSFACTASATAREVEIGGTGYLRSADGGRVVLFKSQDAMSKVIELAKANADNSLFARYVACVVPADTKVLVITGDITGAFMSGAGGTADVMVITGQQSGCQGVVPDSKVHK
jgi:hypothetical protein